MKVLDVLNPDAVCVELKSTNKPDVINELCGLLHSKSLVTNLETAAKALMDREKLGSTGIGQGVAIPHGKTDAVTGLVAALGLSRKGVNFEALDGEPVHIVFLLLAPPDSAGAHLKALARISRLLKDKFFRQSLKDARTVEDIRKLIQAEDVE